MTPIPFRSIERVAQAVFWLTLVFTFAAAVMPAHAAPRLFPWDKAEHFAAFYTLTCLAAAAFPRRNLFVLACLLSGFGAAIELVQALPMVNRDGDVKDWLADTIAITAALAPLVLAPWRAWLSGEPRRAA
ncbi:MAG TPA: VanZ family protein [Rhizomicrobium sp.]|jgi:VanZ family protein